jgi:DNA repair protein RadD
VYPLRDYQADALERLRVACRSHRRVLLVSATGSGKTRILVALILGARAKGLRVLVVGPRREIVNQFWSALYQAGIRAGIIMSGDDRIDGDNPVQVASKATLVRRDLPPAEIVIVDEAHQVPGESYAELLSHYPEALVIGATATPSRLDGRPLGEHFDVLIEAATYSELIDWRGLDNERAIVAPVVYAPKPVDLSGVSKVAGEYHAAEVESMMRKPHVIGDVVETWSKYAQGRSTVLFAVGVAHSRELVGVFSDVGVRAAHLDGDTPEPERERILVDLELGRLDLVSNVDVLTEGWDQPRVKCCIDASPTLSLRRYMQRAGRILRPWGELPPILLDHAGNCERHGLPHEDRAWSLDGRVARKQGTTFRVCGGCFAYVEAMPCPLCGYASARKPREVRTARGELHVVASAPKAPDKPPTSDRLYFDQLVREARARGWKPGAVSFRFKERYGFWPRWPLGVDDAWRKAIENRCKIKAWEDEQKATRAPAPPREVPRVRPAREKLPSRQTALPLGPDDPEAA